MVVKLPDVCGDMGWGLVVAHCPRCRCVSPLLYCTKCQPLTPELVHWPLESARRQSPVRLPAVVFRRPLPSACVSAAPANPPSPPACPPSPPLHLPVAPLRWPLPPACLPGPPSPPVCPPSPPVRPPPALVRSPSALVYLPPDKEIQKALWLSGWYYSNLDRQGAQALLREASPGAFILRNSGDKKFDYSLSVQTACGPTSVRLHREDGYFRLDSEEKCAKYMLRSRCPVELVQQHVEARGDSTVWVDASGRPHAPVALRAGLRKQPPSLQHASRLAVHKALHADTLAPRLWNAPKHERLALPSTVISYLGEYPYYC